MASLVLTLDEVRSELGSLLGVGRTYASLDSTTQADLDRVVRAGRRKFFSAHRWRHLETPHRIVTNARYDTGTVEVVDGVVTLTGGTFPADSDDYVFLPAAGGVYEIASRDSDTQITLQDTSLGISSGASYDMDRIQYDLPSGFVAFLGPITIENSSDAELREVPVLPEWTVRGVGSRDRVRTDRPEMFTVIQTVDSDTAIFTPQIRVYPIPDQQYTLTMRVRIEPGDGLGSTNIAHEAFSGLMRLAILAAGEEMYVPEQNTFRSEFMRVLPDFVRRDAVYRDYRQLKPRRSDARLTPEQRFWQVNADVTSTLPFGE